MAAAEQPVYILNGHGSEGVDTFIVPEDVHIVAKARPGQTTTGKQVFYLSNAVQCLSHDTTSNPKEHEAELVNALGSVVIYGPGEECPNFAFTLHTINKKDDSINILKSGIEQVYSFNCDTNVMQYNFDSSAPARDILYYAFMTADYPKWEDITPLISTLHERLGREPTYDDIVSRKPDISEIRRIGALARAELGFEDDNELSEEEHAKLRELTLHYFRRFFIPTAANSPLDYLTSLDMKGILGIDPVTGRASRPGTYYNFICRFKELNEQIYNEGEPSVNNPLQPPDQLKSSITSFHEVKNKNARNILKRSINEAERKRKRGVAASRFAQPPVGDAPMRGFQYPPFELIMMDRIPKVKPQVSVVPLPSAPPENEGGAEESPEPGGVGRVPLSPRSESGEGSPKSKGGGRRSRRQRRLPKKKVPGTRRKKGRNSV